MQITLILLYKTIIDNQFNDFLLCSLRGMRAKVWKGRTESPLFNCKTYATDLERLFEVMWQKYARGEKPDHITELQSEETKKNIKITLEDKMTDNGTCVNKKEFRSAALTA